MGTRSCLQASPGSGVRVGAIGFGAGHDPAGTGNWCLSGPSYSLATSDARSHRWVKDGCGLVRHLGFCPPLVVSLPLFPPFLSTLTPVIRSWGFAVNESSESRPGLPCRPGMGELGIRAASDLGTFPSGAAAKDHRHPDRCQPLPTSARHHHLPTSPCHQGGAAAGSLLSLPRGLSVGAPCMIRCTAESTWRSWSRCAGEGRRR